MTPKAGLPIVVTPGSARFPGKCDDCRDLTNPKQFYYIDEGPQVCANPALMSS